MGEAAAACEDSIACSPDSSVDGRITFVGITATLLLVQVRIMQGRIGEAVVICDKVRDRYTERQEDRILRTPARSASLRSLAGRPDDMLPGAGWALLERCLALVHLERGEWQKAGASLDIAYQRAFDAGLNELAFIIKLWDAELGRLRGDHMAVDRALGELDSGDRTSYLRGWARHWRSSLDIHRALDRGDRGVAERYCQAHRDDFLDMDGTPALIEEELRLAVIRAAIERGDADAAERWLTALLQSARAQGRVTRELHFLMWQSWLAVEAGDRARARSLCHDALVMASSEGHVRPFAVMPAEIEPLVAEVLTGKSIQKRVADHGQRVRAALNELVTMQRQRNPAAGLQQSPLTLRELEVLRLLARGMSNREVASELCVAMSTVKTHLNHIYDKLGARRRTQALARAREFDLL